MSLVSRSSPPFTDNLRFLVSFSASFLETTANVDRRTDQLLQEALQKSFQSGTILAVAHRLDTIIDFDLCLVLGSGRVLEYGPPAELIRSGGYFASMVNDTGETMSEDLRNRAFQKESKVQAMSTRIID